MNPIPDQTNGGFCWRWKPVDIIALVIAFAIYWPLGFAVLAWKLWNDRQPAPQDLGQALQTGFERLQRAFEGVFSSVSGSGFASSGPAPTGNAAFDAHIREEWARIEADRQKLNDEVAAFRAFLNSERTGDYDVYERFRRSRGA